MYIQFSKYGHPKNYDLAFDYYEELASKGNATAQQMVGFIYATGIGNVVQRDQAKALLYHTFAALGGDTEAEMTLGYRYLLGIGTDEKCEDALYHYKNVAKKGKN
jgi:SEL1 protein